MIPEEMVMHIVSYYDRDAYNKAKLLYERQCYLGWSCQFLVKKTIGVYGLEGILSFFQEDSSNQKTLGLGSLWRFPKKLRNRGIIHFHGNGRGGFGIRDIALAGQGFVWSVYDYWPWQGSETVQQKNSNRSNLGYHRSNRPKGQHGLDIDRLVWIRKAKAWRQKIGHLVVENKEMKASAFQSELLRDWPSAVIKRNDVSEADEMYLRIYNKATEIRKSFLLT